MPDARILIVEDEAIAAMDIQQRLAALGYPLPDIAYNGEEGLRKADEMKPDLVLMDIMMPGKLDGIAASELIRSRFDIPVIFLTAYTDENTLRRAKITAPYGYIVKPFQERELHITVDMALYRHRMERELREREKWLATTLRSIGDAVIATDEQGLITFINPVAGKLTGFKPEEVRRRGLTEVFNIVNRDTRKVVENPVTKVLREGRIVGLANHTVLIARDGREIPINDSAAPIKDDQGNILGVILVFSDITEREKFEETLEKAYAELQAVNRSLSSSRRASLNIMEDALAARKQAEELNVRLSTEVEERRKAQESLLALNENLADMVLQQTRLYSTLAHINGAIVRMREQQALFDEACRIIVAVGFFRLAWIGLLDEATREVRPAAGFGETAYLDGLRIIADDVPEGKGPTGRAVYENRYTVTPDFETDSCMLPWRDKARAHGLRSSAAFPLRTGGRTIGALTIYSDKPSFFSDEETSLLISLSENISFALESMESERQRAEAREKLRLLNEELELRVRERTAELQEANREMESFIYTVSHDLRAPLRHIAGFSKILADDYPACLDDTAKSYLKRIYNGTAKMDRLVEDLLRLSLISKQELSKTEVDLSALALAVAAGLRETDIGRNTEIIIHGDLKAVADRWLMEAVLTNLLGNAWKFTSKTENARIEFGVTDRETGAIRHMEPVFFVKDNGAGFDQEQADMMFSPFHRLHGADDFEGTGIGLTIVERIIRRHGGKVWAVGEVGKGATVYFTLG